MAVAENAVCTASLLLVSREPSALNSLWNLGRTRSWEMKQASSGLEALEHLQSGLTPDLVLLDLTPEDTDGLRTLRWLHRACPELPVILLSYSEKAPEMWEGIRSGACDCLVKPIEELQLEMVLKAHLGSSFSRFGAAGEGIGQIGEESFFVAANPTMRKLREQVELLAKVNVPVLILGESGSGKEIVASLIHKLSGLSACRFLKVHCAAIPGDLLESGLFGYERDALTGALHIKRGRFDFCDKGTVLLDEICELPGSLQAKLVHALQDKQIFEPEGESPLQVRILATTSMNIEQALADKKLRVDLYHLLSVFTVQVPPLRKRKDEILLLLGHFMNRIARHYGLLPRPFSTELLEECQRYPWPGNLRELENFVKRYLVMRDVSLVPTKTRPRSDAPADEAPSTRVSRQLISPAIETNAEENSLKTLVRGIKRETERNAITTALEQTHWNRKEAAQLLNISYRGLLYKIQQYQLGPAPPAIPKTSHLESDGRGARLSLVPARRKFP